MSELREKIITCVVDSGLNDYDQRSALGMARSWVDGHELQLAVNSLDLKPKRDQLAQDLVAIMEEYLAENEEYIEALRAARAVVNKPFQVAISGGARLGKPKEQKKSRESAIEAK